VPIVLAPGEQPREPQLNAAARSGDIAQVESLLKAGCDVNARDFKSGDTPLLAAVQGNHRNVAAVLIAHGADVNAKNGAVQTALYAAKSKDMTEFLIAHGADLNVRDASADTPLHDAVLNPDKMKVLLAHGAVVNAHNKDGETPLDWAIRAADAPLGTHNQDVVKVLLAHGAIASKNGPDVAPEFPASR
jgi:ankyrin repeat protein